MPQTNTTIGDYFEPRPRAGGQRQPFTVVNVHRPDKQCSVELADGTRARLAWSTIKRYWKQAAKPGVDVLTDDQLAGLSEAAKSPASTKRVRKAVAEAGASTRAATILNDMRLGRDKPQELVGVKKQPASGKPREANGNGLMGRPKKDAGPRTTKRRPDPTPEQLEKAPEKCKQGHAMRADPSNVYVHPHGGTACRVCIRERNKAAAERRKAAKS